MIRIEFETFNLKQCKILGGSENKLIMILKFLVFINNSL